MDRELTGSEAADAMTAAFSRMQQSALPLAKDSFTEAVAALFLSRPGQWIDARELMRVGGQCAWRTRVSEARRRYGWIIENRVRTVPGGVRVSEYRRVESGQEAA